MSKSKSDIEDTLAFQLKAIGFPFVREHRFHPTRMWRFDFANGSRKIAIEVQGGLWLKKGGHTSGKGVTRDIEKHNEAVRMGWIILYATRETVESGEFLNLLEVIWGQRE